MKLVLVLLFAGALVCTMSLCNAARRGDEQMAPIDMGAPPKTIVRYPVPLSDDIQQHIISTAVENGVSPALVMAIIQRESGFDPGKIGDNGRSFGLMQVYASEHTDRCVRLDAVNLLDPYQNVRVGVDILAELMSHGKSLSWVLMAYNGGMSYAGQMSADGNVSSYAIDVMDMAERISDNITTVEVY